jgi:hypothetical protein
LTTIFSKIVYPDIFVLGEFQHSVLFTNLEPDELYSKGIINFIYDNNKLNIRHKFFVKEKKATLNFTTPTNWIRQTIDDKTIDPFVVLAQKKYSLDLGTNPELKNNIERNGGQIRFEFERIGFNLGAEKISCYSIDRVSEWSIPETRPDEINYLDYAILKDNLKKNMNHKFPLHPNGVLFYVQKSEFYNEGTAKFAGFDIGNPEFKEFLNQKKSEFRSLESETASSTSITTTDKSTHLNPQVNDHYNHYDLDPGAQVPFNEQHNFFVPIEENELYNNGITKSIPILNEEIRHFKNQKKSTTIPVEHIVINNITIGKDKNAKLLNQPSNERSGLDDLQSSKQNVPSIISLSVLEKPSVSPSFLLVQKRYKQDLKASPVLQAFIKKNVDKYKNSKIRFDFNDIAFILKKEGISARSLLQDKEKKITNEVPKELNEADYQWFLDSLAIRAIKIEQRRKLKKAKQKLKLIDKPNSIIQQLFYIDKHDIQNRRLISTDVKGSFKFNNAIKAFVVNAEYKGRLLHLLQPYVDEEGCSMSEALDKVIEKNFFLPSLESNPFTPEVSNAARLIDHPLSVDTEIIAPRVQALYFEQKSSSISSLNISMAIGGAVAGGILVGLGLFAAKKLSNLSRSSAQTRKETQSLMDLESGDNFKSSSIKRKY